MEREAIEAAATHIRDRTAFRPEIAIVLGSGLGLLAESVEGEAVPFAEIPNFPVSTAPGHEGRLILGRLFGRDCAVMQGRVHLYEGYSPQQVVFPMRVLKALGASTLVLTNAAGGMNPDYRAGDLVVIEDHLSLAVAAGLDPLRGPNDPDMGPRFVSMKTTEANVRRGPRTCRTRRTRGRAEARCVCPCRRTKLRAARADPHAAVGGL